MADKKKHKKLRKAGPNARNPANRPAAKRLGKKSHAPKKKLAKKKSALKKAETKTKTAGKKTAGAKTVRTPRAAVPARGPFDAEPFELQERRSRSAGQSGDLQGLSDAEAADSESVEELIEEGNAFEAGVVSGVENAGNRGDREVHTQEVPEDDVPGEYLDEE